MTGTGPNFTGPKFGTSGLRGLVTDLTPDLVGAYTRAFLATCPTGGAVHLGWDLRPSSPDIARVVADSAAAAGYPVLCHGALPTPALALWAGQAGETGQAAIMITGSHIPADRNGLKFYTPEGEITKAHEAAILAALNRPAPKSSRATVEDAGTGASDAYLARYVTAFGPDALHGLRIGVYQHSSVARELMMQIVTALGAAAVPLARSETFIPVDTEAVDPGTRAQLATWCLDHQLDALISTDGDADRPMVTEATGRMVQGDVLGALTAQALGARVISTPVSSNTMIDRMAGFDACHRTRIGSPYVIAAMEAVLARDPAARVVGYEANGGFLLGFAAAGPAGPLAPLMTRDCLLPMLAPLAMARRQNQSLADLVAALPARFTATDRITGIAPDRSAALIAGLQSAPEARAAFFADMGAEARMDLTDGLRVIFENGEIVHLRPSGNAPEFRCYTEAGSAARAQDLLAGCLTRLEDAL